MCETSACLVSVFPGESRSRGASRIPRLAKQLHLKRGRAFPWNYSSHLRSIFRKSEELVLNQTHPSLEWGRVRKGTSWVRRCDFFLFLFRKSHWVGANGVNHLGKLFTKVEDFSASRADNSICSLENLLVRVAWATCGMFITAQFVMQKLALTWTTFARQSVNLCGVFIPWGTRQLLKWINKTHRSTWLSF